MNAHIIVEHPNGEIYYTSDFGARIIDFIVPSTVWQHETERMEGGNGSIPLLSTYSEKTISLSFDFFVSNVEDFIEKRNEFNRMFKSFKTFFISDSKLPGVRWGVRSEPFTIERDGALGRAQIDFTVFSGHSESNNTETSIFTTSTFLYENVGDIAIDMNKQNETEIEFKGASTNLVINNLSTGETWSWLGNTTVNDVILLKGITVKKNATSIFGLGNHKTISLAVGENEFEILGTTSAFTLTIKTRFYYF